MKVIKRLIMIILIVFGLASITACDIRYQNSFGTMNGVTVITISNVSEKMQRIVKKYIRSSMELVEILEEKRILCVLEIEGIDDDSLCNIKDYKDFQVDMDTSFLADINEWGKIYVVSGICNRSLNPYPKILFLNEHGGIMHELSGFLNGTEIKEVFIDDYNKDGLKDMRVVTQFSERTEEMPYLEWYFQQSKTGSFELKGAEYWCAFRETGISENDKQMPDGRAYAMPVDFWEREFPAFGERMSLKNELEKALLTENMQEYLLTHESDCVRLSDKEIQECIANDKAGFLQAFYLDTTIRNKYTKEAIWYYFKRDNDIIVRYQDEEDECDYIKFIYSNDNNEYDFGLVARSEIGDYYFIECDGEDYTIVVKRDENNQEIIGVTAYCISSDDDNKLGWTVCLKKEGDSVKIRYYNYTSVGSRGLDGNVLSRPEY